MLGYYRKLFQTSYRLLKVRAVNLGWLVLMAILITLHILMLNAGLVPIKAVLAVLFLLGVPFEMTLVTTVLSGPSGIVNQSDEILYQAWLTLRKHWYKLLLFVLLLLLVWLPFGGAGFTNVVINFIGFTGTMADPVVMHRRIWLTVLMIVYLGLLSLFVWFTPRLMGQLTATQGQIKSVWQHFKVFIRPMAALWVPLVIINELGVYGTHQLMGQLDNVPARATSMVILTIFVIITLLFLSSILVAIVWESIGRPDFEPTFDRNDGLHSMAWFPAGLVVLLVGMFSFQAFHFGVTGPEIVTVAHRATINNNGAPNTVSVLQKTVQKHPNYVEIDVQETKDKQFVVYHGNNVTLQNRQKATPVRQLTLKQLQRQPVKEGSQKVQLNSLAQFLTVANAHHQRVMVEIKVNDQDSKDLADHFVAQYGHEIVAHQGLVHTMNYRTLERLKDIDQELIVGYILPFNLFSIRNMPADFYSLQAIGLNQTMVQQAHSMGAAVFAWTPERLSQMQVMKVMGVDGQITDRTDLLNQMTRQPVKTYYWAIVQEILSQFM